MLPALSQVCSLNSPFEADVADYAAGACHTLELWLGKLETYLQSHTIDQVLALLAEHEMATPVASYQGGLLATQGDARREHWKHFEARLKLCQQLKVEVLVVAADIPALTDQQALDRVQMSLGQAADLAEQHGVRLALEFQARSSLANNLQTAASLVGEAGSPALGLCFDVFHYYTGPSKFEDLAYLSPQSLFHVQLCDLAGVARELATDGDRVLPGDGDFALAPIIEHLRSIDYRGAISVELMNPAIWQIPARQFGEVAMTALRKVLGQAAMQ